MIHHLMLYDSAEECPQKIDMCFMLDRSGSVTMAGWRRTLEFTNTIINSFNIAPDMVRSVPTCIRQSALQPFLCFILRFLVIESTEGKVAFEQTLMHLEIKHVCGEKCYMLYMYNWWNH